MDFMSFRWASLSVEVLHMSLALPLCVCVSLMCLACLIHAMPLSGFVRPALFIRVHVCMQDRLHLVFSIIVSSNIITTIVNILIIVLNIVIASM